MVDKIPEELTLPQLRNLFIEKNMLFSPHNKYNDCKEIQSIGYYKLKEFAYPFSNWYSDSNIRKLLNKKHLNTYEYYKLKNLLKSHNLVYNNLKFSDLLNRYKQDKCIRMNFLSLVESLEVSLDSNVSDILGKHGAFSYLNFYNWADYKLPKNTAFTKEEKQNIRMFGRKKSKMVNDIEYSRYVEEKMVVEQEHLKRVIKGSLNKHTRLKNSIKCSSRDNVYYCVDYLHRYLSGLFPSVWVMTNIISFGEIQHIIWFMMKEDKNTLSKRYRCSPRELISWIGCLHNIRNICAHNEDFIDMSLKRSPENLRLFRRFIVKRHKRTVLSSPLFIIKYLSRSIPHENNSFNNITISLKEMIKDSTSARYFGFKNRYAINILSESENRIRRYY